jgi:hypothetical protein
MLVVGFTNPASQTMDPSFETSPAMDFFYLFATSLIRKIPAKTADAVRKEFNQIKDEFGKPVSTGFQKPYCR